MGVLRTYEYRRPLHQPEPNRIRARQKLRPVGADVRRSLVRWPSEEAFSDLALDEYSGVPPDPGSSTFLARALGIAMGGQGAPGSCSAVFSRLSAGR